MTAKTVTQRLARDLATVAAWIATLPSWGDEIVAVRGSAETGWTVICGEGTHASIAWAAGVVAKGPMPDLIAIEAAGPPHRADATVARTRWRIWTPDMHPVFVQISVPVSDGQQWADAVAAARGERAKPATKVPGQKAPAGELDGQAELFPELTEAAHE